MQKIPPLRHDADEPCIMVGSASSATDQLRPAAVLRPAGRITDGSPQRSLTRTAQTTPGWCPSRRRRASALGPRPSHRTSSAATSGTLPDFTAPPPPPRPATLGLGTRLHSRRRHESRQPVPLRGPTGHRPRASWPGAASRAGRAELEAPVLRSRACVRAPVDQAGPHRAHCLPRTRRRARGR
jgi:hypothetical protein